MYYSDINADEVLQLLGSRKVIILDMRDEAAYKKSHLEGAVHANGSYVHYIEQFIDKSEHVLIYCYHGVSSQELARNLCLQGYQHVYNLVGGWQAWSQFQLNSLPDGLLNWLIEKGFSGLNLDEKNAQMQTPLIQAVIEGDSNICSLLVEGGADLNIADNQGYSPLWHACLANNEKLLSLLIHHGADVNYKNARGTTPLIYTSSTGNAELLMTLIQAGANVRDRTCEGFNAFELAGSIENMSLLKPLYNLNIETIH